MLKSLATITILALAVATPAFSQTATPQSDATHSDLQEVVVTARLREESIRDVPGTISAVTADQL